MENQPISKGFEFSFETAKSETEVFDLLKDIPSWWSGLFNEIITGKADNLNDEFLFTAGEGAHWSKQQLIELVPNRRIVWLVTECSLSFLDETEEWVGTKICFELSRVGKNTNITFFHKGLIPEIECYDSCSSAWMRYMKKLENKLNPESLEI